MKTQPMSSRAQSSPSETARLSAKSSATLARAVTPWSSWRHAVTSDGAHSYMRAEAIIEVLLRCAGLTVCVARQACDEADPSLWEGTGERGRVKLHRGDRRCKV
jgi:hypothetical protein